MTVDSNEEVTQTNIYIKSVNFKRKLQRNQEIPQIKMYIRILVNQRIIKNGIRKM